MLRRGSGVREGEGSRARLGAPCEVSYCRTWSGLGSDSESCEPDPPETRSGGTSNCPDISIQRSIIRGPSSGTELRSKCRAGRIVPTDRATEALSEGDIESATALRVSSSGCRAAASAGLSKSASCAAESEELRDSCEAGGAYITDGMAFSAQTFFFAYSTSFSALPLSRFLL